MTELKPPSPSLPDALREIGPSVRLIAGPTAAGKSAIALDLARRTGGVIVNADALQLYADLRVLTARPDASDEDLAPHRLYGIADAADTWSVGRWLRAAVGELESIHESKRTAIVVGGAGLYFNALTRGLADIPAVPAQLRLEVEAALDAQGEAAIRRRLSDRDPQAQARILPGDRQRLIRALAVAEATGRSLSAWQAETRPALTGDWSCLVVEPERRALYSRCDARLERMFEGGAVEEVKALLERGLDPRLPAMKAVGVREIRRWLAGEWTRAQALESAQRETRRYAKRQLTWFRNQMADWPRLESGSDFTRL